MTTSAAITSLLTYPCGECGGTIVQRDLSDRTRTLRGRVERYPVGLLIPVCEGCGSIWTDLALAEEIAAGVTPVTPETTDRAET